MKEVTIKELNRMIELYKRGLTIREVAKATGRPFQTVGQWLKRCGVSRDTSQGHLVKSKAWKERKRIAMLYQSGLTCREIANLIGCSDSTVRRILKRMGLDPRGRSYRGINFYRRRLKLMQQAWRLHEEGLSLRRIAKEMGLHYSTVCNYVHEYEALLSSGAQQKAACSARQPVRRPSLCGT